MAEHQEHVTVEAWSMDCVEGECEHRNEDGEPEDLSACEGFEMEVCVDCMVARGHDRDPKWWEGAFDKWPCTALLPPLVEHGPEPEPPIFKRSAHVEIRRQS